MTIYEFYETQANYLRWPWIASWWPEKGPTSLIVATSERSWDAKDFSRPCPHGLLALGWSGSDLSGRLLWVGWDLDVGHGGEQYPSTDLALADAFRIRAFFEGCAEIRLSKSGRGVHVRHRLPEDVHRPADDGSGIAKAVASKLRLKADPSALGRQAFWFWTAQPGPEAFKLITQHGEMKP